jgi:hypothetical protein
MRRLLPLLLASSALADPPRPADLGDTWTLTARGRFDAGDGANDVSLRSSGARLEVLTEMGNVGTWRVSLSAAAAGEANQLNSGTGPALPTLDFIRELDLGLVLSRPPQAEGEPTRFYAFEVGSRTADEAGVEEGIAVSFVGGSTWKVNETLNLGYLILAEDREVESDLFMIVPTFRWAFAPDWSLATGRKALVLSNQLAKAETLSLTLGYEGEETRLQSGLAGEEIRLLDQRLYADFGYAWVQSGWNLRATLGWELDSELTFQVAGVETDVDPGQGLRVGLIGRYKF